MVLPIALQTLVVTPPPSPLAPQTKSAKSSAVPPPASPPPLITTLDYTVLAHGARLSITGTGLASATVTIGGVAHTLASNTDTNIVINAINDSVPLDTQSVAITTAGGTANQNVTIIHLTITEMDSSQPGTDAAEFIEIYTGLSRTIDLTGYRVLTVDNGTDVTYDLAGTTQGVPLGNTSATGYFLIANSGVSNRQATFNNDAFYGNEGDGVLIVQRTTGVAAGTALSSSLGNLIDAISYDTNDAADDAGVLNFIYGSTTPNPKRVQVDEGIDDNAFSIARCGGIDRLDGSKHWAVGNKTPGTANNCAPFITDIGYNGTAYSVLAHGGRYVISGAGLQSVTAITLGGITLTPTADSNFQRTITSLPETVPVSATSTLSLSHPFGAAVTQTLTVIHLVINEIDSDQPNSGSPSQDRGEFIELYTGLNATVNLTGYVVAVFDGSNDQTYGGIVLGNTSTSGYHLSANSAIPNRQVTLTDNSFQNEADALAIYQRATVIPNNTSVIGLGDIRIDALVYDTEDGDDTNLLNNLLGASGAPQRPSLRRLQRQHKLYLPLPQRRWCPQRWPRLPPNRHQNRWCR